MTLGDIIFMYRIEHDISQREFATRCNVSNAYISMLEKNINPRTGKIIIPSTPQLIIIANAMGMSLEELLNQLDDPAYDSLKADMKRLYGSGANDPNSIYRSAAVTKGEDVQPMTVQRFPSQIRLDEAGTDLQGDGRVSLAPVTTEARILSGAVDRMPEADRKKLLRMAELMFEQYSEFFQKGTDAHDP